MIVKLFGLLDILSAVFLFLMKFGTGEVIGMMLGIYLILKGLIFFSFVGVVDVFTGILMVIAGTGNYIVFSWIMIFWLVQKGFVSLYG